MKTLLIKIKKWGLTHKKTFVFLLIVVVGITYGAVKIFSNGTGETRYVLAKVERGNIIASINGTGQVSSLNQVDVTSKSSGELIYLNAKSGQEVKTGTLIAQIDSGDAAYEVETAKLSYEELITVDDDELRDAEDALDQAETSLKDAYIDARATLASSATDMSDVMADLDELFNDYLNTDNNFNLGKTEKEYVERARQAWYDTDNLLDEFTKVYRTVSSKTDNTTIESMLIDANQIANSVAETAKYSKDAVIFLRDHEDNPSTEADTAYTTASGLVTTANSAVSETLGSKNTLVNAKRTLKNAEADLKKLKDGPDTLDVRNEQLALKQKQDAYSDYFIRAPFDGIIASVDGKKGQNVSSGSTIATLITKQKIAEISLNEIDVAKVEVGQKATLTFDAFEDISLEGQVIEVDLVGTVTQGVVNYKVKIGFDTPDDRIKPGMTVSADIVTEIKQGVLTIPTSAIKTQGNASFVEVVENNSFPEENSRNMMGILLSVPPTRVPITTGLSNDTSVEITSGLNEGDQFVVRTITGTTSPAPAQTSPSLFGGSRGAGASNGTRGSFPR